MMSSGSDTHPKGRQAIVIYIITRLELIRTAMYVSFELYFIELNRNIRYRGKKH
jgi:hypothetical protein